MNLLERTILEVREESAFVAKSLQNWWGGMTFSEQAFSLGLICASFLLIGVLQPEPKHASQAYGSGQTSGLVKQFLLAAVVLIIMTFGLDIAIEGVT